ncbi:MAG: exo-alpha-sialidase, partial [Clostridia bacterium]|nr:exo-alpha-sialidase [Clostridia bacterium]
MKKFKKILAIFCAMLMSCSCFACGTNNNNSTQTPTSSSIGTTSQTTSSSKEPSSQETSSSSSVNSSVDVSSTSSVSQTGSINASSQSSQEQAVVQSLSLSGQQTTANSLAEVSKIVTVTANYSDNSTKILSEDEYKVFVEYKNVSEALVTVMHLGTGISSSYTVNLSAKVCAHAYTQTAFTQPTLTSKGVRTYTCSACSDSYTQEIPQLNETDYTLSKVAPTCTSEGMDMYTSSLYGTFTVKTSAKLNHTTSYGNCEICKTGIGNLTYNYEDSSTVFWGASSYPRLLELKDGTWLCGFDTWGTGYAAGTIVIVRSNDKGVTWSKEVSKASFHDTANCANVALFQLENGVILCGYRALGTNLEDPLSKALHVSISKDNGYTWEKHSTIVDAYNLKSPVNTRWGTPGTLFKKSDVQAKITEEGRLGFFEPHFGYINGELTVMYADDLTTMMENPRGERWKNYETQYIIKRTLNGTTWSEPKIVLDGTVVKTVSNITGFSITDFSRDGMPVFDKLSDGTNVLVVEGTYRDNTKTDRTARTQDDNGNVIETHPFEILISYSKDGEVWSDPVEIYVPKGEGTKASAPFVCVTDDDRIVVSFQTDEDAAAEKNLRGDGVSVMKTIISDGTPIDKITKDNFYESQNPFYAPAGTVSSWNGMMEKDGYIYCVTGTNFPQSSIKITKGKIPTISPRDYHTTTTATGYNIRSGAFG